jgi:hypothetical protein
MGVHVSEFQTVAAAGNLAGGCGAPDGFRALDLQRSGVLQLQTLAEFAPQQIAVYTKSAPSQYELVIQLQLPGELLQLRLRERRVLAKELTDVIDQFHDHRSFQ